MDMLTFIELNKFVLDAKGWDQKPESGGKALFGTALKVADITDAMPIRFETVEVNRNGRMRLLTPANYRNLQLAKKIKERGITPNKNIKTFRINDGDPIVEGLMYLGNSYRNKKDPTRLSSLDSDTTGVVVRFLYKQAPQEQVQQVKKQPYPAEPAPVKTFPKPAPRVHVPPEQKKPGRAEAAFRDHAQPEKPTRGRP